MSRIFWSDVVAVGTPCKVKLPDSTRLEIHNICIEAAPPKGETVTLDIKVDDMPQLRLVNLTEGAIPQCNLRLQIEAGAELTLTANGNKDATLSVAGVLVDDLPLGMDDDDDDEMDFDDEDEEGEGEKADDDE